MITCSEKLVASSADVCVHLLQTERILLPFLPNLNTFSPGTVSHSSLGSADGGEIPKNTCDLVRVSFTTDRRKVRGQPRKRRNLQHHGETTFVGRRCAVNLASWETARERVSDSSGGSQLMGETFRLGEVVNMV